MKAVSTVLLGTILAHASIAFAAGDPAAAPSSARLLAEVPFTLHQNAIILEATVNGRDTVHLLLDTGWGPLALVSTAAQRLNLRLDYPAGVVRFYAGSPIPALPPGEASTRASVPMILLAHVGALPFTDAVLLDGKPVRALFDTGGSGGFMATRQLVDRAKLETLPDTGSKVGIGMLSDGKMTQQRIQFANVGRIALGPFVVDSPRVIIAPSQLEGDDWGHDLIIGYGFMRNYIVTFDYPGKTITLQR